jgi:hypothetical protein
LGLKLIKLLQKSMPNEKYIEKEALMQKIKDVMVLGNDS